jgi:hypothetical protein
MNLRLIREPSRDGATLGSLYADGHWCCWTVEDEIREVPGQPVDSWKVQGATAIPAGRYRVHVTFSQRYGRRLPLLGDVPGFTGVRIHPGNVPADTEGCLLPGSVRGAGRVLESRKAFELLYARIEIATGETWIAIENPQ